MIFIRYDDDMFALFDSPNSAATFVIIFPLNARQKALNMKTLAHFTLF